MAICNTYLAKTLPLKVTIQASYHNVLVVMVRCFSTELQQIRKELCLINSNDLYAVIALAYCQPQISQLCYSIAWPCNPIMCGDFR